MKKQVVILGSLVALLMAETAAGAEPNKDLVGSNVVKKSESTVAVAPTIGATSFSLIGDGGMGAKSGISIGAMSYWNIGVEKLDLEAGLQYMQMGGKDDYILAKIETNLDYLAAPIGVRYRAFSYGEQDKNFFFLRGGLAPTLLLSAKVKTDSIFGGGQEDDIKSQLNTMDVLAYAGVGGTYSLLPGQEILYDLSYMRGLQKVFKDADNHSEGFVASVSYSLAL